MNHLKKALQVGVAINWVQNEIHPLYFDEELLKFCKENGISFQAWRPLDKGRLKDDAMLKEIGQNYNKSASQVALRWIMQHNCMPLPGSKSLSHIEEDIDIMVYSSAPFFMSLSYLFLGCIFADVFSL